MRFILIAACLVLFFDSCRFQHENEGDFSISELTDSLIYHDDNLREEWIFAPTGSALVIKTDKTHFRTVSYLWHLENDYIVMKSPDLEDIRLKLRIKKHGKEYLVERLVFTDGKQIFSSQQVWKKKHTS